MSAFLCSDKHISVLAQAVNTYLEDEWIKEVRKIATLDPKEIFAELKKLNIASVNYRYQENTPLDGNGYMEVKEEYSLYALLKAAQCYLYQSCEEPDYKHKPYYKLIEDLNKVLIDLIN